MTGRFSFRRVPGPGPEPLPLPPEDAAAPEGIAWTVFPESGPEAISPLAAVPAPPPPPPMAPAAPPAAPAR